MTVSPAATGFTAGLGPHPGDKRNTPATPPWGRWLFWSFVSAIRGLSSNTMALINSGCGQMHFCNIEWP